MQSTSNSNLNQSAMYKSVISQINEDFISKESLNLLLHEEEFLNQYKLKIEQEKNCIRQSYDFIMKHIYDQISQEMANQCNLLDKQISQFADLFQKFKNHAIEYKNISSQIPPISSNLKNMWKSSIMNNINNYFQEVSGKQSQSQTGNTNSSNFFEMIDWEECVKAKAQHQQQQHQYQQIYFQQKELLLQTECISQNIYQQLQVNRTIQIKDQSLDLFFKIVDSMKPHNQESHQNQEEPKKNQQQTQQHMHILENQRKHQNTLQDSKHHSLERNAVINTEFSPEKMGFKQQKTRQNTDSQQCSEIKSQKKISSSNLMIQSEVNHKVTKYDVERWDSNQQILFTQIQSRKPSVDESNLNSALQCKQKEDSLNETLPLDKLVQLQKVQLLKFSESNFDQNLSGNPLAKEDLTSNKEDETDRPSLKIIAEDFVERIDSYKAPYMFRDEDQLDSQDNLISNYNNDQHEKSQLDSNQSVQQPSIQPIEKDKISSHQYLKRSRKMSSRNGKRSGISSNGGDGGSKMNQLFTDRDQEFQFDEQQDQFNNTYSIQLSVSRISNQDVDQLNETINNLKLLNDSFQNNNLNETLMNLSLLNTQGKNSSNNNNNNNRLSLKQLLAQTNRQLAQQLNLNSLSNNVKTNNVPPVPPNKAHKAEQKINSSKFSSTQSEAENMKKIVNANKRLYDEEKENIFSENDLKKLREQLRKHDSLDDIEVTEQDTRKIAIDSPAYNPMSFQRKLKNYRVNLTTLPSSKNLEEDSQNESYQEPSQQYSIPQNTLTKAKGIPHPPANGVSSNNNSNYNYNSTHNSSNTSIGNLHTNAASGMSSQPKQILEQQMYYSEANRKNKNLNNINQSSRRFSDYDSNNSNTSTNSHNIHCRSNSNLDIPPLSTNQQQQTRKANEYYSVDQARKGYLGEYDSQRSNQSNTIKDPHNTSITSGHNASEQSRMSVMTSKKRFENSLTRPLSNQVQNNGQNNSQQQPSYNIEFEGFVKQKQNLNDSFSRNSFRLNSQQSLGKGGQEKFNSASSPRNTFSQMDDDYSKIMQDSQPTCTEGYQFIKRDMKSIDIYKPKTYSLFDGENVILETLESKGQQVISSLWVRENVFAFATSDSNLLIYDTSKAESSDQFEKQQCLKKFSSKVPIQKMVRVSESLIGLSSKHSKNIKLFDVNKLDVSLQLIGHNENIADMVFIEPSILISTSVDGSMIVWQDFVITHKKQNKNEVKLMQTTNDRSKLICIDSENQILVYQLMFSENKNRLCEIRNDKIIKSSSTISSINAQFSSNNILACGTDEGIIRLYDIDTDNVLKIIKVCLTPITNLLLVEHPIHNFSGINYILIVGSESDDDLVTFSKLSNTNDIISTNSKFRVSKSFSSNNLSTFFINNTSSGKLQLFTLDQSTSQFSLWNIKSS